MVKEKQLSFWSIALETMARRVQYPTTNRILQRSTQNLQDLSSIVIIGEFAKSRYDVSSFLEETHGS